MRAPTATELAIEALVLAAGSGTASPREIHLLRESLLSLARLAQAGLHLAPVANGETLPHCPREW